MIDAPKIWPEEGASILIIQWDQGIGQDRMDVIYQTAGGRIVLYTSHTPSPRAHVFCS